MLSLHSPVFLLFPYSFFFSLFSLFSFLSPHSFNLRFSCHDLFLSRYFWPKVFFCQSFDGLVCLVFSSAACLSCCFLFFSFPLKSIGFVSFSSAVFSGPFNFCQLLLLELYKFPLICQISVKFSSLFFFTFISCLYDYLSIFVLFPNSFLFLWYITAVSPLFCYCFIYLFILIVFLLLSFFPTYSSCSEVYPLSVVSPTLCRTSLLLFVVNQSSVTCHRFGLLLFSILSVDIIFSSFLLPFAPPSPLYGFLFVCCLRVINDNFLDSLLIKKFLLIAK